MAVLGLIYAVGAPNARRVAALLIPDHRPGAWDAARFVAGEATGTLLSAPAARHLFAAWGTGGRLVYRSNVYDLAADAVSAVPAAG